MLASPRTGASERACDPRPQPRRQLSADCAACSSLMHRRAGPRIFANLAASSNNFCPRTQHVLKISPHAKTVILHPKLYFLPLVPPPGAKLAYWLAIHHCRWASLAEQALARDGAIRLRQERRRQPVGRRAALRKRRGRKRRKRCRWQCTSACWASTGRLRRSISACWANSRRDFESHSRCCTTWCRRKLLHVLWRLRRLFINMLMLTNSYSEGTLV